MTEDAKTIIARAFADELRTDRHGCLCDPPTEDMRMVIRGDVSLPALARAALDALRAAGLEIVQGWQPIKTAPRDGSPIDIWGYRFFETGKRSVMLTGCRFNVQALSFEVPAGFHPTHWKRPTAGPAMLDACDAGTGEERQG